MDGIWIEGQDRCFIPSYFAGVSLGDCCMARSPTHWSCARAAATPHPPCGWGATPFTRSRTLRELPGRDQDVPPALGTSSHNRMSSRSNSVNTSTDDAAAAEEACKAAEMPWVCPARIP